MVKPLVPLKSILSPSSSGDNSVLKTDGTACRVGIQWYGQTIVTDQPVSEEDDLKNLRLSADIKVRKIEYQRHVKEKLGPSENLDTLEVNEINSTIVSGVLETVRGAYALRKINSLQVNG
ncbi:hypothetical protein G5I_10425 [Acromyrmex echinatior]|uniref:Uncharacterized protein n=1 Tax=Acromyrmex echinatior TaxID=103372 RepID=F4WWV5_ACREC|nr:hypothetical protein G5I_10425 [Acromyrmex echinatior]